MHLSASSQYTSFPSIKRNVAHACLSRPSRVWTAPPQGYALNKSPYPVQIMLRNITSAHKGGL